MTHRQRPGVSMLGDGLPGSPCGDAIALWNEAIEDKRRAGRTKQQAVRELVAEQPELHQNYVEEHNRMHGPPSTFRGERL